MRNHGAVHHSQTVIYAEVELIAGIAIGAQVRMTMDDCERRACFSRTSACGNRCPDMVQAVPGPAFVPPRGFAQFPTAQEPDKR